MTSRSLMGIGDSIMNLKNINYSTNNNISNISNISNILDKSSNTNSTFVTPNRYQIKPIYNHYSLIKKDIFNKDRPSINSRNLSSSISNNVTKLTYKKYNDEKGLIKYIRTSPNKESIKIINNADKILKDRKNNLINMNQLVKSVVIKKSNEVNLENYKIKLIINKRNEINDKLINIKNTIKTSEKIYERDYKKFLDFVESNNESQKEQELILNKIKKITYETENEYNKENTKNKKLQNDVENIIKQILVLKNYGSSIHKVFKSDFLLDKIPKIEGKNYIKISDSIIELFENEKKKNENNEENFNKILESENLLMEQFSKYEENLVNMIDEKENLNSEIINIKYGEKDKIMKLKNKKEELSKRLQSLIEDKNRLIKTMKEYISPEYMDTILNYILELAELLDLNISKVLYKEKAPEKYIPIASQINDEIKQKEIIINENIEQIENIINSKNEEDKLLIEEIISERKKAIKKQKLDEIIKQQNEALKLKNMKAIERAQRIVIKGRKVLDYPIIKTKKRKKLVTTESNEDDYIYYSSDEN
jgi:hypothetical protein